MSFLQSVSALMLSRHASPHRGAPDREAATRPAAMRGDAALPLRGRRIFLVEDEFLVSMMIEAALEDAGALVLEPCFNVADGISAACHAAIDAAILDVDLGGSDVFPVARELAARGIPFLFHTGHGDRADLAALFADAPVCRKPTPVEALIGAVAALLDRKH